jgi:Domain of Unknown Function (DUF349)
VETTLKGLIDRFRSKPEWQSEDPAVRAEAVMRLPASESDVILALAREDPDPRVRRAAVKKLSEVGPLAELARTDVDPGVREEAEARLAHLALHEQEQEQARAAVVELREPRLLAAVAREAPLAATRETAVRALGDARALASVVREAEDLEIRLLALERIEDQSVLLALALKTEQKAVALAAVDRLTNAEALAAVAEKARAGAASRRARARLEEGGAAEPAPQVTPSLSEQDEDERRAYEEARAAQERDANRHDEAVGARTALLELLESAEGEAIPAAIERARSERAVLPPLAGAEVETLEQRIERALTAAPTRHAGYLAGLARREELTTLVQQAEEAAAREDLAAAREAFSPLEAAWRQATATADLPELRARFDAASTSLRERGKAARDELSRADQEHLEQLLHLADRAEALVAKGAEASLRDTDHAFREIRAALDNPGHFPTRKDREAVLVRLDAARKHLYPVVQQLREDAEWKRWANVTVQEALCARAEALLAEEDLEQAAEALRDLDARWKQAKEAPKEKAEALWTRFKAARDEVKTRADAYFARQAEALEENLRLKQALCEKAEALAESTDWVKTSEDLRKLQAEWKTLGPVPRPASRRIWERFRKPCDRFFTRWQEHRDQRSQEWGQNLARKEALCEQAEALQESSDWEKAASELKRLQADWRTIGPVKKSRSEAVWQRFRAACDHFFDRYKNRDEYARLAAQAARETICAELEALLPAEGAAGDAPPDLAARVQAAQTAWRQAGGLPHDQMQALDERFASVRDRLVEVFATAFEGTDLDPAANRRKAEKLVARAEALLQELAPSGAATVTSAVQLASRLREALAANTIGGRAAVEERWLSASAEIESAQSAWKRLGPLPGPDGHALAERFERACHRFFELRPKIERPRAESPRSSGSPRPSGRGRRPPRS